MIESEVKKGINTEIYFGSLGAFLFESFVLFRFYDKICHKIKFGSGILFGCFHFLKALRSRCMLITDLSGDAFVAILNCSKIQMHPVRWIEG